MRVQSKGKRLEYMIRDMLIESGLDTKAKRSLMSGATWLRREDVVTSLSLFIEAKNRETWRPHKWYQEALSKSPSARLTTLLVLKANRTPIYAFLTFSDLLELLSYAKVGGWE